MSLAAGDDMASVVARLGVETEALARQLELASGDAFYLVVDPPAGQLSLRLGGVVLQQVDLADVSVVTARVAFVRREVPAWQGVIWSGGELDPMLRRERVEIEPPSPGAAPPAAEPLPEGEDSYVPSSYRLRFDGGFALELDSDLPLTAATRFRRVWRRFVAEPLAAAGFAGGDRVRLRATVPASQFVAFYRSVPPDVRLLVLPAVAARSAVGDAP